MASLKKWKQNWELKSLSFDELFNVVVSVVLKQLTELEPSQVTLDSNIAVDYEADSVDVIAMLVLLEEMFRNASTITPTVVPTDQITQIVIIEDIFDIIYDVLLKIEQEMDPFVPFKPDYEALKKRQAAS